VKTLPASVRLPCRPALGLILCLTACSALSQAIGQPTPQPVGNTTRPIIELETLRRQNPQAALQGLEALVTAPLAEPELRREAAFVAAQIASNAGLEDASVRLQAHLESASAAGEDGSTMLVKVLDAYQTAESGAPDTAWRTLAPLMGEIDRHLTETERARVALVYGYLLDSAGEIGSAITAYQQAVDLAEANQMSALATRARLQLAWAVTQYGQNARGETLVRQALQDAEKQQDMAAVIVAYTSLGMVMEQRGDLEGFLAMMTLAIDRAKQSGILDDLPVLLGNVAHYYLSIKDFGAAEVAASEALQYSEQRNDDDGIALGKVNLGLARIGLGQLMEGRALVREGIAMDARRGLINDVAAGLQDLGNALEAAGDAKGAVEALHESRRLSDQIYRDDQRRAVLELQEKLDAERRERELVLLNAESALKTAELKRQSVQRRLWWLLGGVFALVLGLALLGLQRLRRDNSSLLGRNQQLRLQSERDALTGLANRRQIKPYLQMTAAEHGFSGAVLMIDVDHFKRINDVFGHAVGDKALQEIARRLRTFCREADLAVRMGGEEFLLLIDQIGDDAVPKLVARLLRRLAEPYDIDAHTLALSASIGFARSPLQGAGDLSIDVLLKWVDGALYLAKSEGRQRAVGIQRVIHKEGLDTDRVAQDLLAAVARDELVLMRVDAYGTEVST
jgi:diguanylate cyclase (GGDEF)-like protein